MSFETLYSYSYGSFHSAGGPGVEDMIDATPFGGLSLE
jgi:hypothetical protein